MTFLDMKEMFYRQVAKKGMNITPTIWYEGQNFLKNARFLAGRPPYPPTYVGYVFQGVYFYICEHFYK